MFLNFALVLHFAAILITFWGDYYILRRNSRSRSRKIRILSISKFFVYCCHIDIDFTKNCILTNRNSFSITGENFVAIGQG